MASTLLRSRNVLSAQFGNICPAIVTHEPLLDLSSIELISSFYSIELISSKDLAAGPCGHVLHIDCYKNCFEKMEGGAKGRVRNLSLFLSLIFLIS